MIELEEQVNQLINQILLKAENQYELLICLLYTSDAADEQCMV